MTFPQNRRAIPWVCSAFFLAATLCILLCFNYQYLRLLEGLTLFQDTDAFMKETLSYPAGALQYVGSWLTQLFYNPAIGAVVYALMLLALMWLVYFASGAPLRALPACAAVPAVLLIGVVRLGYVALSIKAPGFVFADVLGWMLAFAAAWGYGRLPWWWLRLALIPIAAIALYPPLGIYAFCIAGLCALKEVRISIKRPALWGGALAFCAMAVWAAPHIIFYSQWLIVPKQAMYMMGLPEPHPGEVHLFVPFIIVAAMAAIAMLRPGLAFLGEKTQEAVAAVVFVAACAAPFALRCTDANFHLSATITNAMMRGDFGAVLEARSKNPDLVPTRANVLLTNCALWRMGRAGDVAYTFRQGSAPYTSFRHKTAMRDITCMLLPYHVGKINNAYRWGMEYSVENGFKPYYLMIMAKCAIINDEMQLAQRYLDALSHTRNYKWFVDKYTPYLTNKELRESDPEIATIRPLMAYRNDLYGDGGRIEAYYIPLLASAYGGSKELMALSLDANLMQKNVDGFMQRYKTMAPSMRRVPVHYQEAALIWADAHEVPNTDPSLKIDESVRNRYNAMFDVIRRHPGADDDELGDALRPRFGNTYWFYYLFTNKMQTR